MSSNPNKFTALPQVFDASTVAPKQPMEAIPNGWYNAQITDGEVKPTADGAGIRMELEWTILDGPFKGRKVFDGLNVQNPNPKAQEIAQQDLSAICHATGVIRVQDVQELYNKPHQIKVDSEAGRYVDANNQALDPQPPPGSPTPQGCKYYEARNRFRGCKAFTGAAPAAVAGSSAAPAGATPPWAAKPGAAASPAPAAPKPPAPAAPAAPKPPAPPPATVKLIKKLMMTAKANGLTADQFRAGDAAWTDELLVREGYAEIKEVPETAAAPAAATPAGAPVAPPWARG